MIALYYAWGVSLPMVLLHGICAMLGGLAFLGALSAMYKNVADPEWYSSKLAQHVPVLSEEKRSRLLAKHARDVVLSYFILPIPLAIFLWGFTALVWVIIGVPVVMVFYLLVRILMGLPEAFRRFRHTR